MKAKGRKGLRNLLIVAGSAIALIVGVSAPASAAIGFGGNIVNYKSQGKCIGISAGYAGLWNCTQNPDQRWTWGTCLPGEDDWCYLKNGNGNCLGLATRDSNQGTRIIAQACPPSLDRYWRVILKHSPHEYIIQNYVSHLIIGVKGGSTANGAQLVQWADTDALDQHWF